MLDIYVRGVASDFIIGHKEAVENAVLVREVATNSQESVTLADLPGYLKRHLMGVARAVHV